MSPLDLLPFFLLVAISCFAIGWGVGRWIRPKYRPPTWEQRQFTRN